MSIDCSGFDQNIVYLNFSLDGSPDQDDERCEVQQQFQTPLLSETRKYWVSVNRFSIPCASVKMNEHIQSAIMLTTWDQALGRVMPYCAYRRYGPEGDGVPDMSAEQTAYLGSLAAEDPDGYGAFPHP